MTAPLPKNSDFSRYSFTKLCEMVKSYACPYEDVSELVEDKGYDECMKGDTPAVIAELRSLSAFFENMENKNEEQIQDLANIYLLAGEFCQYSELFLESVSWIEKAIIVNDLYDVAYHSLALSYIKLGDTEKAIKSLEQEITIAPGNYYTYLLLADLYESLKNPEGVERVLRNLLSRDANNIQALHKLICHYQKTNPELDVTLLRNRLMSADKQLVKLDLIIWTYHMCITERFDEALLFLADRENEYEGISLICLLKAHVYGCQRQYAKKRTELMKFKRLNQGREEWMRTKLEEFARIFGEKASTRLEKKLSATML